MTVDAPAARRRTVPTDHGSMTLYGVAGTVAVVMLIMGSHPAGPAGMTFLLFPFLGLVATACWVVVVVQSMGRRRFRLALIITPLVGLLTVGLVDSGVATRLRFGLLDRSAFEAVVASTPTRAVVLPDHDLTEDDSGASLDDFPGTCPTHIGTLRIGQCESFVAGYLFYDQAGSGLVDDGGVAYLPAGVPEHDVGNGSFEDPQFEHLSGPWYAFASSW